MTMHCRNSLSQIFVCQEVYMHTRHKKFNIMRDKVELLPMSWSYVNFVFCKKKKIPSNYKTTAHCKIGIYIKSHTHTWNKIKNEKWTFIITRKVKVKRARFIFFSKLYLSFNVTIYIYGHDDYIDSVYYVILV